MVDAFQDLSVPDLFIDDDLTIGDDLLLSSDSAVISFGADADVTLTHVHNDGLRINSNKHIQFGDSGTYIHQSADGVLDLVSDTEIELNATLVDVNANLDVSGTVTATGTSVFASLDISGDIDVDGTTNLDVVDIDGAANFATDVTFTGASANIVFDSSDNALEFADSAKAIFGADSDMSLFHNGNNGFLDNDTGTLFIQSDAVSVKNAAGTTVQIDVGSSGVVFNEGSADFDFRVESDGNTHMLFVDAGNNEVAVGTSNVKATLHVFSSDSSATPNGNANDLFVENSGNAGITIGSGSSSAGQIRFADSESSGRGIVYYDHSSDFMALYTAGAERFRITAASAVFNEDSNDQDFRVESDDNTHMLFLDANDNRVYVGGSTNVNTSALQVTAQAAQSAIVSKVVDNLYSVFQSFNASGDLLTQITGAGVLTHNGSAVITTADNTTTLNLVSTDTDANAGPHLRLSRNATGADSDALGQVEFSGRDDAGNDFIYAQIEAYIVDASNGSEDGYLEIFRGVGGTERVSGMILSSTDTVFNENSADIDFRVESNSNTHALFVNSSSDGVGMGATASPVNAASTEGLFYSIGGSLTVASNTETLQINRNSTGGNNRTNIGLYNNGTLRGTIGTLGGQDGFYFQSGGDVDNLQLQDGVSVFNESSADIDFRVESNGNANMLFVDANNDCVGIATSSPSTSGAALVVQANAAAAAIDVVGRSNGGIASMSFYDDNGTSLVGYIQGRADDNEYRFWTTTSDIISLGQNNTERARFEDSGVVFNEGSNDYDFRVESNNDTHALFLDAGNDRVIVGASASTAGTDFVSFDAAPGTSGQLIQCGRDSTDTKNQMIFTNPNGTVGSVQTAGSSTLFNTGSDARLKENVADANDAGALIDAIQVRQFDWIADGEHQRYGMVAQELNTVAPEAVSAPEDPDEMMGVDYSKLVPMLVKEIQSLRARVAQLENT